MVSRRRVFLGTISAVCAIGLVAAGAPFESIRADVDYPPVMSMNGMVTSAHPIASQVGVEILRKGGNAYDAAVAVTAMLGVVEPGSSGIGGEGFALFRDGKSGEIKALNWTTRTPVSPEFAKRRQEITNPESIMRLAPPGTLAGLVELLEEHGTMKLADVLAPAIQYAQEGFVVSEDLHASITRMAPSFKKDPYTSAIYLPGGQPPPVGALLRNANMARTLRIIAEKGKDGLYKGEIAQEIVRFFKEAGGVIQQQDLDLASKPVWLTPIETTYRGNTVYAVPPNSGGLMLLETLNILEGFDLGKLSEIQRVHTLAETYKLVFEDRDTKVSDPEKNDVPVAQLISKDYAATRRGLIKADAAQPWRVSGPAESGTTHLVVADKDRNVISVTNTQGGFSRVVGKTGIFFCNGIQFLSQDPKHPNFAQPNTRMRKNLSPALVVNRDGKLILAVGAAGGSTIWQTVSQAIVGFIDLKLNVQQALTAPRIAYNSPGAKLMVEQHFKEDLARTLGQRGHQTDSRGGIGSVQAISIDPTSGALSGGADPRRDGKPVGY